MRKCGKNVLRAGLATDDNVAHAHCMLDTQGYKYAHSGCVILIAFPQQLCTNAPQRYVIRTLTVLGLVLAESSGGT